MAFAAVAGQTITIVSAITIVVMTIQRRRMAQLPVMLLIAAVLITAAIATMVAQGTLLIDRLDQLALLNE